MIRERVQKARRRQQERFAERRLHCNAQMGPREIREYCRVDDAARTMLRTAIQQLSLSARAYDRILKVARTIADLHESETIAVSHVAESIQYRTLDRKMLL